MQAAIVPTTGKLLDYPGLIMAFLFVVFAAIAYLLSNTKLFLILALVAVERITTVYVGIFKPGSIGWGSAYTFDGILVAAVVMVVIDTLIWPSPPEPRLLESIAEDLERIRGRPEPNYKFARQESFEACCTALEIQLAKLRAEHLTRSL